jgi:phosphoribosylanthranilate isomerase
MTRIKVCGITNLDDARSAIECGADAIGFVFASSKRRATPEQVRIIVQHIAPFVVTVGVFMDETVEQVKCIALYTGVDVVQLHGSEPSAYCAQLGKRVIKRIPIANNATTNSLLTTMDPYEVSAFLLDPGTGSGQTFDWSIARGIDVPVIVAGGLGPDNVGQVVRMLHPYGVDVCSGVEKVPGIKDKMKIRNFVEEVRRCS